MLEPEATKASSSGFGQSKLKTDKFKAMTGGEIPYRATTRTSRCFCRSSGLSAVQFCVCAGRR